MTQTAVTHLFKIMIEKDQRNLILAFVSQLTKDEVINSTHCNEAFMKLLQNSNKNINIMSEITSWTIFEDLSGLKSSLWIISLRLIRVIANWPKFLKKTNWPF